MVQEFIILNIFFCNMNIKMLSIFWDLVLLLVTVQSTSQVIPNLQFPLRCISTLSDNKLYWGLNDWCLASPCLCVYTYTQHTCYWASQNTEQLYCFTLNAMPASFVLHFVALFCCLILSVVFISLQRDSL